MKNKLKKDLNWLKKRWPRLLISLIGFFPAMYILPAKQFNFHTGSTSVRPGEIGEESFILGVIIAAVIYIALYFFIA